MIKKLKYIFFDFSNKFKDDFWSLFKRSIWFLIAGIIGMILMGNDSLSGLGGLIGGLGFLIFGLFWAHNIASTLTVVSFFPRNVLLKVMAMIFFYAFCMVLGYIYFAWSMVKVIIIFIKNVIKNNSNNA